jgi:tRNA dimethylallyltransferase
MKGNADPGGGEHRHIIGAVTDGHRQLQRNLMLGGERNERFSLGFTGHDWLDHRAGDAAGRQRDSVGDNVVKTQFGRDPLGEGHQPAGNQRRHGSRGTHRRDQLPGSGRHPDALGCGFEQAILDSGEQRDALFERGREIDLAVHRTAGDVRDRLAQPDKIAEFVEHLVFDDCRFQIGDEQPLAPFHHRLDNDIDGRTGDRSAGGLLDGLQADGVEDEIAGPARRQPDRCSGDPGGPGDRLGEAGEIRAVAGAGDQGEDHLHGSSSYRVDCPGNKPAATAHGDPAPAVIVIAGPTASGKSALALELAEDLGGTVINADSIQCYRDLHILTARPDAAAERRVPHRLYGFLDAGERGSVARWRMLALEEIAAAAKAGRLPILVGGSGLYLRALIAGLAPVPAIPAAIRQEAIELHRALGGVEFRERLAQLDPIAAQRLAPGDKQRLVRAFEVVRATGAPLTAWQRRQAPEPACRFGTIVLAPPRERLYRACDQRFARMIAAGALTEAAALAARALDPGLPAMKAVGLPELLSHLRGDMTLDAAIVAAQRATRRYAKRQTTWFRHQMTPDLILGTQDSESLLRRSRHFIDRFLLTRQS